jgi:hypothetical protein
MANPLQHWDESLEKSDEIRTLISLTREGWEVWRVGWGGVVRWSWSNSVASELSIFHEIVSRLQYQQHWLGGAAPPEPTQRLPSIRQLQEKQTTPLNEIVKGKLSTKESQTEWQQLRWRQKWWLMMAGWLAEPQPNREQKKRRERESLRNCWLKELRIAILFLLGINEKWDSSRSHDDQLAREQSAEARFSCVASKDNSTEDRESLS